LLNQVKFQEIFLKRDLVVRVECRLEREDREDEGGEHGGRVQDLQLLLLLAPEQSVD
jgi:hypothetical protein